MFLWKYTVIKVGRFMAFVNVCAAKSLHETYSKPTKILPFIPKPKLLGQFEALNVFNVN